MASQLSCLCVHVAQEQQRRLAEQEVAHDSWRDRGDYQLQASQRSMHRAHRETQGELVESDVKEGTIGSFGSSSEPRKEDAGMTRAHHSSHPEVPIHMRGLAEEDPEESLGCCDTSQMPPKTAWQWYLVVGLGFADLMIAVGEVVVSSLDEFVNYSNLIVAGGALTGAIFALGASCHWTRSSIIVLQCGQILCIVAVLMGTFSLTSFYANNSNDKVYKCTCAMAVSDQRCEELTNALNCKQCRSLYSFCKTCVYTTWYPSLSLPLPDRHLFECPGSR